MRSHAMKRQFAINGIHLDRLTCVRVLNAIFYIPLQTINAPRQPWPPVSFATGKMTLHPKHLLLQWEPEFTSLAFSLRSYWKYIVSLFTFSIT